MTIVETFAQDPRPRYRHVMKFPRLPDLDDAEARRKWRRRMVILGALLGLLCRCLPPDYAGPCETLANLCSGGL